jgi:predicted nucleotidyltransferase
MTELDELARDVRVSGRTLRRAAERGTFLVHRPTPKKAIVPEGERLYVRKHWPLLSRLVAELRTSPNVRLAVLFGSAARGEQGADSDLDIAVRLRRDDHRRRSELAERLASASGCSVQLVSLEQLRDAPMLLADVLRDGRVLVDRDGEWVSVREGASAIAQRAREAEARVERDAWELPDALAGVRRRTRR